MSDVLGLEGIKYSHIQHADLSKIEIELHEMGLNRAHHALLQGMRTQDILFKRIEACAAPEEGANQVIHTPSCPIRMMADYDVTFRMVEMDRTQGICIPTVRKICKTCTVAGGCLLLDLEWNLLT